MSGPPSTAVAPPPFSVDEVKAMAQYYGIDIAGEKEYWLLDIAKQSIIAPLLPPWAEEEDANGDPLFVNSRTGIKSQRHPLDEGFLQLTKDARNEGPPPGNEGRSVMEFPGDNGGSFFYDFATSRTLDAPPDSSQMIMDFDKSRLPKYSTEDVKAAVASGGLTPPSNKYYHVRLEQEPSVRILSLEPEVTALPGGGHRGGGKRLGLDLRQRRQRSEKLLQHLTFFSRWFEDYESQDLSGRFNGEYAGGGLRARHATLKMSLASNAFDITIHSGSKDEPTVTLRDLQSVTTTAGMPVQPWDMHVGAVLETLGNYVVLQGCNSATGKWLTNLANKVLKLRAELLVEFRKYNQEPFTPAMLTVRGMGGGRMAHSYCESVELQKQASISIQGAADQCMRLADLLEPYRPSIAALYRQRLKQLRGDQQRLPSSGSVQSPNAMLRSRSISPSRR